ncbi:Lrp/AsnC family transcriptional regulator [Vibrio sp. SCSIO 43140]|uniref:Transcriptional regulator AsnC family n=2 Tax=Vibrio TaxID=662 RepID=A0A090RSP7_9VIBR|nr:Lrp/AsnC family transcriptional regulator [Vibrio sp. SCSIO 43140]USD63308.1 Lrp/AsnC family transcriptional regulator [Vibrio sp. SCSIO 43140]GAL17568.1 transcriptional regulator AsnC family [Vibrio maritimus]GAL30245.1 transcriptional regulator AsnC family [Vibrio variabilis]
MDEIDKKILKELQSNARLSNQELADRIALSPSPCLRRVRALEKQGVIRGYHASVDQEACGLPINVFVLVKLDKPTEDNMRDFERHIDSMDEVLECFLMTGNHDYLLHVVSESLKTYEQFIRRQLTPLTNIASIESSFAFGQVKRKTKLPIS